MQMKQAAGAEYQQAQPQQAEQAQAQQPQRESTTGQRQQDAAGEGRARRIAELASLITRYQASYFNGEGEISDSEFDALWDELTELDPSNPVLQRVGADAGNFPKAKHVMPMGSQAKVATESEFLAWAARHPYDEYLVEYKLDGASLELQYAGGKLVRAVTRGDGSVGDVISDNARRMAGVVEELSESFTGGVRGEVIMTRSVHRSLYSDKANCRNAANGIMKRKDGEGCEHLTLITYDVWSTTGKQPFLDEEGKLTFLKANGFNVVPLVICHTADEVISYREHVAQKKRGDTQAIDYDIDGLVIKERAVNHEDALRARPERQIAFKFNLDEAVTVVRAVEWSESGATYTPIALFDPVELNGTTVKRASLVNPNLIRQLGVRIGSRVTVVKRGEIIPKIIGVLAQPSALQEGAEGMQDINFPTVCASCESTLVDEGTRLYCPNPSCPKRVLHQLLKWVAVVDIPGLGETLLTALFNTGKVRSIADIYALTEGDLAPYFLGDESLNKDKRSLGAAKVFSSIQSRRKVPLAKFIAGFDIDGVGETVAESLVAGGFTTLRSMLDATQEGVAAVYGFAQITARTFVRGIAEYRKQMEQLILSGAVSVIEAGATGEGRLWGKSFCFTGELTTMKRAKAQELVKTGGGVVKSSVVKGLSYLVTNDTTSGSAKNKRAQELGVPVINESEFLALLG